MNLDGLVDLLRARVANLVAVYVFGSGETGGTHGGSDIDLAVLAGHRLDPLARADLAAELGVCAGRDVDLVDLRAASTVFRFQVVSTGRLLLCLDTQAVARFEMHALADYCRLNEERRAILDDVRRLGRVYAR